jgi:glycogen debranching enzyme
MLRLWLVAGCLATVSILSPTGSWLISAQSVSDLKKTLAAGDLSLERRTHPGSFFDVLGRRAAVYGYEHRGFEAWAYPMKILEDFRLSFTLEGYPLEVPAEDMLASITVRPDATIFTYSHAAFRVRQIIFVPIDEPAIVLLLDVTTTLPIRITAAFRPRLRLMWPAGSMTPYVSWNSTHRLYALTEETRRFAGVVGSPSAQDVSLMPYQEEPRDAPIRFVLDATPRQAAHEFIPIVIAGSVNGAGEATATLRRVLGSIRTLHDGTVAHYRALAERTTRITTPIDRLDTAFSWAKIGIDKGVVSNPLLGTGLVAGYRTSGDSERPGFAWFFGRDALWTVLASSSIGDFETVRTALAFLRKFQRDDGKIPHEISQSASMIPWFTDYPYAWASADATPLYVIAHADYWRATGDLEFLKAHWDSIVKAYRFSAATDKDGDGLLENTGVGHGWVEGGALYPPHEEVYMQGLWSEALAGIAELSDVMRDQSTAAAARAAIDPLRQAIERTFWLDDRGFYAFGTKQRQQKSPVAEPGPEGPRRQRRLDELSGSDLIDEDTVLPAVPLWFRTLDGARAQREIDRLGSAALATDWGARLLSADSALYDPLSYHYGSVWPLFTGWSAMAAYRYGRPHVGYQALTANALLTFGGALGYVTELLSGDFNAPFGRSSHHQIWSEAMVITPFVRGLLGIEVAAGGSELRFAPQLPADWDRVSIGNVAVRDGRYDLRLERSRGRVTITIAARASTRGATSLASRLVVSPAFPLDAAVRSVTINGRQAPFKMLQTGDVQQAHITVDNPTAQTSIEIAHVEGSDVYTALFLPAPGTENAGLRIIRSTAGENHLRLVLEGRGGRSYALFVRTPRRIGQVPGVTLKSARGDVQADIAFEGPADRYVRREIVLPFLDARGAPPPRARRPGVRQSP